MPKSALLAGLLAISFLLASMPSALAQAPAAAPLELSRPVRPWEFLVVPGTQAAMFGNEAGHFEAWVYPLKILRDLHLKFHIGGEVIPAEAFARTVTVRPESSTILYAAEQFQIRETIFVPVKENGAIITIEVETAKPLEVEVAFQRDFTLEWPAALGGSYIQWDEKLRAFFLGEELDRFAGLVGSPTAVFQSQEYGTNFSSSAENSFLLGTTRKGRETKTIVIAGSSNSREKAEASFRRLSEAGNELLAQSAGYYREYLNQTLRLDLPDSQLQQAYDWSRISMVQGMVNNPFLGTTLIAGYRTSGDTQRPGFAWFFGRDSLWSSLALDAAGDFASTRAVLEFLATYQRADGKIPHEVSQSATFVPWFENYPYPYASADATPLFIIAMNDYVVRSGDVVYAKKRWGNITRAYQFLHSTYDPEGLPQNSGAGHGWVEGGPLLPVRTEIYQCGLSAEALRALSNLALLVGNEELARKFSQEFERLRMLLNQRFWSSDNAIFAFAIGPDGKRVNVASVLSTVPMWFDLLDEQKSEAMINKLADYDHQADWGMRLISSRDPRYDPGGYHFGAVWPLFTGWASVGEYRYHRALPAYANLRANAMLALNGSLGHVTEVLSGDYYAPTSGGVPDQIWSAAMVVNPLLRGLLGLEVDSTANRAVFAPHVPADWNSFRIRNLRVGSVVLDMKYTRSQDEISLDVTRTGSGDCTLTFSPAVSLRAKLLGATLNSRPLPAHILANEQDAHVIAEFPIHDGSNQLHFRLRGDFELGLENNLPSLGSTSLGLRIVSESWDASRDNLTILVSGISGSEYLLSVLNPTQIASLQGAEMSTVDGAIKLLVRIPSAAQHTYAHSEVKIHFAKN